MHLIRNEARPEDHAVVFTGDSDTAGIDMGVSSP